jgi:ribosome-associated protein
MTSASRESRAKQPKRRATQNPVSELTAAAVDAMLDKKAHNVTVMDMREVSGVADVFVLGTGDSDLQIKAIADAVSDKIRTEYSEKPWHTEGYEDRHWILLDYVDLVVHVFDREKRDFYDLERLWGDAPREEVQSDGSATDVGLISSLRTTNGGH